MTTVSSVAPRTWNPAKKLSETIEVTRMREGQEVTLTVNPWRCEGRVLASDQKCMLVWEHPSYAIECAARGHRNRFTQDYQFSDGTETSYVRQAIRRDGARPTVLAPVAEVQAPVPPADPVAELRALASTLGYRLSKVPAKASKEMPEGYEDLEPAF
jgi:hypothetical protein